MSEFGTSLKQVANTHGNPALFSSGAALALASLINDTTRKFKVVNKDDRLLIRGKDKNLNQACISLGIDYPTIKATSECMLAYDPIPSPTRAIYSYEASRVALYIGTDKEFLGPFFAGTSEMGLVVYLIGLDNITLEEVSELIINLVDMYKRDKRGFYTYVHGQKEPMFYKPVWPLGLLL